MAVVVGLVGAQVGHHVHHSVAARLEVLAAPFRQRRLHPDAELSHVGVALGAQLPPVVGGGQRLITGVVVVLVEGVARQLGLLVPGRPTVRVALELDGARRQLVARRSLGGARLAALERAFGTLWGALVGGRVHVLINQSLTACGRVLRVHRGRRWALVGRGFHALLLVH